MENFMQIQLGLSPETSGMVGQILPLTLNLQASLNSAEKAINNDGNEGGKEKKMAG
jgi:hypothetical protein